MKILVKIGSALISRDNTIAYEWLKTKIKEMVDLYQNGHQIIIVTSGAVASGMEIVGLKQRPKDTLELQLLSGMGQVKLIKYYTDLFLENDIHIAQVLLTHHNFSSKGEEETIAHILNEYLNKGIIPVINENDLISKEELDFKPIFSDNDILAALVSSKVNVDLSIILTDVDGLYNDNPKHNVNAVFISEVIEITEDIRKWAANGKSDLGLGGMSSKITAAEIITSHGIKTIVGNGNYKLQDLIAGDVKRTLFYPYAGK